MTSRSSTVKSPISFFDADYLLASAVDLGTFVTSKLMNQDLIRLFQFLFKAQAYETVA